jgi:acyl carrier protein
LHYHTLNDQLEHFILFSSVSALFGNLGQVNYACGNAAINALACTRSSLGLPAVCIEWPGVAEVGMAAAMDKGIQLNRKFMINTATVKHVLEAVMIPNRSFKHPVQSVIPEPLLAEMSSKIEFWSNDSEPILVLHDDSTFRHERIEIETMNEVRSLLKATEPIDLNSPLMDIGLDSLASTQLVRSLGNIFGIALPSTLLFNYPTVNLIVNFIADRVVNHHGRGISAKKQDQPSSRASTHVTKNSKHDIAIIGISCRLPGGIEGIDEFWKVIASGNSTIEKVPFERWDANAFVASEKFSSVDAEQRMMHGIVFIIF